MNTIGKREILVLAAQHRKLSREVMGSFLWFGEVRKICLDQDQGMVRLRRSREELKEVDALVERLRDFIRLNYLTAAALARQIGVKDTTVYDWLLGRARPAKPQRIAAFLDSVPREDGSGIAPTSYEYREYKNWRGIPKLRRCPFCKQAKGDIRRSRGGFFGVCPNCDARGPKRESRDEALAAWNGKGN
jgi:hypothetical protein